MRPTGTLGAALGAACGVLATSAAPPPNIIFHLVDDWGSYDASFRMRQLGRPVDVPTPHIDALHDGGVGFANYYVQPICSPTRGVLLSGRYSCRDGVENHLFGSSEPACLPTERPILPAVLKAAFPQHDYAAHMVGKWHLGYPTEACCPWKRGFDTYVRSLARSRLVLSRLLRTHSLLLYLLQRTRYLGYLNGVGGYSNHGCGPYADFHECGNITAVATAGSSSRAGRRGRVAALGGGPADNYEWRQGALTAGGDVEPPSNQTLGTAAERCDLLPGCAGFTFAGADRAPSAAPVKTYFKSSAAGNGDGGWNTYLKSDAPPPPMPPTCNQCVKTYEGQYSTVIYAQRAQRIIEAHAAPPPARRRPFLLYLPWQAVHEPLDAPAPYVARFEGLIGDHSRKLYAAMLTVLDEALGNITDTLAATGLLNNTVVIASNDNGGMSGTYGMGCCSCGTSCGGLNWPYRGWKDSFYEGGFRGIGFVSAPGAGFLRGGGGYVYRPLLHVSDWLPTIVGAVAAATGDAPKAGAGLDGIDGVNQWEALAAPAPWQRHTHAEAAAAATAAAAANGSALGTATPYTRYADDPRAEIVLSMGGGPSAPRNAATLRRGQYKLMLGSWGDGRHCDINHTDGGLNCTAIPQNKTGGGPAVAAAPGLAGLAAQDAWWNESMLYDVVADPRELRDLAADPAHAGVLADMRQRLLAVNATVARTAHMPSDPNGTAFCNVTKCWQPWRKSIPPWSPV